MFALSLRSLKFVCVPCSRALFVSVLLPPCLSSPSSYRGMGCILYEMATGRPMFPGATVKEELHLVFRLLGKMADDYNNKQAATVIYGVSTSGFDVSVLWQCTFEHFFVFQVLQQKIPGQGLVVMRNLGLISFLNTDLKLSSTMCQGNTYMCFYVYWGNASF